MQRALEHYTDLSDIKRIMQQGGGTLNPEFLLSYFGTISRYPPYQYLHKASVVIPISVLTFTARHVYVHNREGSLEVLKDLLTRNLRQNLNIVVQIASKYSDPLGPENLMKVPITPAYITSTSSVCPSINFLPIYISLFTH